MNYYPNNIGDYYKDAKHLSPLGHGIYRLLMDFYYTTEGPIPADRPKLCHKIGARTPEECAMVDMVAEEFFRLEDGLLHHTRCDEELEHYRALCERNSRNGLGGGRPVGSHKKPYVPRSTKPSRNPVETQSVISGLPDGSAKEPTGIPGETQREPSQEPRTKNQEEAKKHLRTDARKSDERFERFWIAYPKKKNKGDAIKAWDKLRPSDALVSLMIGSIALQRGTHDWTKDQGQFIPYPASWLSARGWEDEVGPINGTTAATRTGYEVADAWAAQGGDDVLDRPH